MVGFVITALEKLPMTGEVAEAGGWRFEVVDLDGRRIDKVIATQIPAENTEAGASIPRSAA
jgi:putative hemolysin